LTKTKGFIREQIKLGQIPTLLVRRRIYSTKTDQKNWRKCA